MQVSFLYASKVDTNLEYHAQRLFVEPGYMEHGRWILFFLQLVKNQDE